MLKSKINKVRSTLETQDIPAMIGKYRLSLSTSRLQKKYLLIANEVPTLEEMEKTIITLFQSLKDKGYEEVNITVGFREVGTGLVIHRTKHFSLNDLANYPENPGISMLVDLFKLSLIEAANGNLELAIAKSVEELKSSLATFTRRDTNNEEILVSDMYSGVENYILNTSIFSVSVKNTGVGRTTPPGIMEKDKNHNILIKDTFKVRVYKVNNNNCLIDCFIRFCGTSEVKYKQARTIKKNILNLNEDDELDVNIHTVVLENYFNKKCGIISSSEEVLGFTHGLKSGKKRFYQENIDLFTCSITYNDVFIYGNENADFWLYYDAEINHVYPIECRFTNKRCPHTGTLLQGNKKQLSKSEILHHLIKQNRIDPPDTTKPKKQNKDLPTKTFFMCIDFETIYDKFGTLSAYSAAAFGFIDKEKWNNESALGAQCFYSIGSSCDIELYQFILQQKNKIIEEIPYDEENKNPLFKPQFIILTWNGSRFDNFILTKTLSIVNALNTDSVFIAKNSILGLKFNGIKCIDLCRFIPGSLAFIGDSFKITNKKTDMGESLSHDIIQAKYFKSNCKIDEFIKSFTNDDLQRMKHYNEMDCIAVIEIYFKFEAAFQTLVGSLHEQGIISKEYNIYDSYTIPALTYKLFDDYLTCKNINITIPKNQNDWLFFKSCIVGGRAQAFKTGKFEGEFASLDVKSLYPFAMINGYFPLGDYRSVNNGEGYDDLTKMGYYNCIIRGQPKTKIIPNRTKIGSLDWNYEGDICMPLSSVDIRILKEYGTEVIVGSGFLFDEVSNTIFSTFINVFKDEKTKQDILKESRDSNYNVAIRETCKLVMNSLAGKTQQSIFFDNGTIVANASDALKFIAKHNKVIIKEIGNSAAIFIKGEKKLTTPEQELEHYKSQAYPIQLGVLVYSYSRYHMYKSVLSKLEGKFYTDTDSVHIDLKTEEVKKLLANQSNNTGLGLFKLGNEFGNFENEIPPCNRAYYIAPKCYALFSDTNSSKPFSKMRFKGVNKKDKSMLSLEESKSGSIEQLVNKIKQLREQTTQECFELYNQLKSAYSEDMFNKIIENKEAYVLCSSIKKHLFQQTDELFDLSTRFLIKKITLCDIPGNELNVEPIIGSINEEEILDS